MTPFLCMDFESGMFAAAAWFIYLSIKELQNGSFLVTHRIIRNLLMIPSEVLLAVGIMVVYNVLCGGEPCISVFFYPYNHRLDVGNVFSGGMQQALYEQCMKNSEQMKEWAMKVGNVVPEGTFAAEGFKQQYIIIYLDGTRVVI